MLLGTGSGAAETWPVPVIQSTSNEQQSISAIAVSPDGALLAAARYSPDGGEVRLGKNDSIDLWALRSASGPRSFAKELHPIRNLAFSHNSQWLSAASQGSETSVRETKYSWGKCICGTWVMALSASSNATSQSFTVYGAFTMSALPPVWPSPRTTNK